MYVCIYIHIYIYTYLYACWTLCPSDFENPRAPHLPPRKQLWEVDVLPANLMNAPAIYQGSVFTSDTTGAVRAVSMQTGKPVWFTNTSKPICQDNGSLGLTGGL